MNRFLRRVMLFLFVFASAWSHAQPSEYLIKGVILEKLTRFVTWPESALNMEDTTQNFVLGVIGNNPFENLLEEIYRHQTIKDKPVEIRYLTALTQIDKCHLLFISNISTNNLKKVLNLVKDRPILSISDNETYSGKGVMINLKIEKSKVRIEIDERAIKTSDLLVSHLLLMEADIVNPIREE